jgi:hypothetical protein
MNRFRAAFTLLEIMMAITIAIIVIAIAVPFLGDMFGQKELEDSFTKFDAFARKAHDRAVAEARPFVLIWHKDGITLEPETLTADDSEADVESFAFGEAKVLIERPVALTDKPVAEWSFWKSGSCEPVRIYYESEAGTWTAEYDSLTARGHLLTLKAN